MDRDALLYRPSYMAHSGLDLPSIITETVGVVGPVWVPGQLFLSRPSRAAVRRRRMARGRRTLVRRLNVRPRTLVVIIVLIIVRTTRLSR